VFQGGRKEKNLGFRNVVLATDASGAMDCQEVKRICVGRNHLRQVTSTQGTKDESDIFWSRRSKRWPGEDVHVWNGKWREK